MRSFRCADISRNRNLELIQEQEFDQTFPFNILRCIIGRPEHVNNFPEGNIIEIAQTQPSFSTFCEVTIFLIGILLTVQFGLTYSPMSGSRRPRSPAVGKILLPRFFYFALRGLRHRPPSKSTASACFLLVIC